MSVHAEGRFYRAQDNKTFLDLLNSLWNHALKEKLWCQDQKSFGHAFRAGRGEKPTGRVVASEQHYSTSRRKSEKLSRGYGRDYYCFGRDSILIGMMPRQSRSSSSGSKSPSLASRTLTVLEEILGRDVALYTSFAFVISYDAPISKKIWDIGLLRGRGEKSTGTRIYILNQPFVYVRSWSANVCRASI